MPDGLILGFDTSAAHCAAALLSGDRIVAEAHEEMTRGQAERLMPMIEEMLSGAGVGWSDLSRIGVGIGPGNFTGIRVSVAAARGLALGLGIPAIGVSSLDAIGDRLGRSDEIVHDDLVTAVDARGGKIYLQIVGAEPVLADLDDLPALPRGAICIGHQAETLATSCDGTVADPAPIAHATARIAARRAPGPRPAPLYIRPPDAAPAKPAPPVA